MEPNRSWHDPIIDILGNLITPGFSCSAEAYDVPNRRWYRLDVEPVVKDEEWLSSTVAKHLAEYYDRHKEAPPWNVIKTTASGGPVAFETELDDRVRRPVTESLTYGSEPSDRLPTTTLDQLENLRFLYHAVDRCTWQGKDCVFQRIELDPEVEKTTEEIRIRERLIAAMGMDDLGKDKIEDVNAEMARRFLIEPVLAVVIAHSGPWKAGTVAGLVKPYSGRDLEAWAKDGHPMPVTEDHLRDLVRGVRELGRCGVQHGDISSWNTAFRSVEEGETTMPELIPVDAKPIDGNYEGDAKALGTLLLWCLEHSSALREDGLTKARLEAAAAALAMEDFDAALAALSECCIAP